MGENRKYPSDLSDARWQLFEPVLAAWRDDEVFTQLGGLLRRLVRTAEGRDAEPSACIIDAQSVKTSTDVPATDQGVDAAKPG